MGPTCPELKSEHREHNGTRLIPGFPDSTVLGEVSPYIQPHWTLSRPLLQTLLSGLYLVTSWATRSQQLCVMTAAVEMPITVEIDEVYQGLATGLAEQAWCQQHRSPACAANTPYSPGLSSSLHCWAGMLGQSEVAPPS